MTVWAAREIRQQAGRGLLLFACLAALVFLTATPLLFSQALEATFGRLLEAAPDLVVRRIDAGGWAPLPAETAVAAASAVPGVLNPTPRLWGVAAGPDGPLTVVTAPPEESGKRLMDIPPPAPGNAVVGQKALGSLSDGRLTLTGRHALTVTVTDTFPADTGLVTYDLVWLAPRDARLLLGIPPGQASDLAIHLFHREEAQVIRADLAATFPWPVQISDRRSTALGLRTQALRMGGIVLAASVPALLALLLIIVGAAGDSRRRMARWGLLKSMGWTTGDIVHLQIVRAALVGLPSLVFGQIAAYVAVFHPAVAGVTAWWLTGSQHLPSLTLHPAGAVPVMLQVAAMVGVPYLAAVFFSTLHRAAGDPWTMLQAEPWR